MGREDAIWDYDNLNEGGTFLGEVTKAEFEDKLRCSAGRDNCEQTPWKPDEGKDCPSCASKGNEYQELHVQVKPLDHEIQGDTGVYHYWYPKSDRTKSKWGLLLKALRDLKVRIRSVSDLEGKKLVWTRKDIEWGDSGFTTKDMLLPIALPDKDGGAGGNVSSAVADFAELDSRLKKDGLTKGQIMRWAKENSTAEADVNAHLEELDNAGTLKRDDEGVYNLA